MKRYLRIASVSAVAFSLACAGASAQPAPAAPAVANAAAPGAASQLPADPWPRVLDLSNGQVLVYQPQVNKWEGNRIDFRAAMAIKVTGAKDEAFGVIFATARTQVDKIARTVVFEDYNITKIDFPTLPNRGAAYAPELTKSSRARSRRSRSIAFSRRSRPPASGRRRSRCRTIRRRSSSATRRPSWCRSTARRC